MNIEEQAIRAGELIWNAGVAGPPDGEIVVFLHGFPEHWRTWELQLEGLAAEGYRAVAPDLPGYGGTDAPRSYDLETIGRHTAEFLSELSPTGIHLVGHDWGGILGHAVSSGHPETVRSFVAACAPHPSAWGGVLADPMQLLRSFYVGVFQIPGVERLIGNRGFIERATKGHAVSDIDSPEAAARALAYYRTNIRPWELGKVRAGRIFQPGLVIHAERDVAIGAALMEATAEQFDDLRGYIVAPRNHFLHTEEPEEFNRHILGFLRAL